VGLTGAVNSYAEKHAAVHAAERVSEVRAVTDEMKVQLPALHVRNDEDIAGGRIACVAVGCLDSTRTH
jgi:hypothetical protein